MPTLWDPLNPSDPYYNTEPYAALLPADVKFIESQRDVRYVCEWYLALPMTPFALAQPQTKINGPWGLFWSDEPHPTGSNWMGAKRQNGSLVLVDGISATQLPISCAQADDGQLLYSKFGHDFRTSADGSITVDGGPWHRRTLFKKAHAPLERVLLPQDGKLTIIDDTLASFLQQTYNYARPYR